MIHARATERGWDKAELHDYAAKELALKRPLSSLRELGAQQLKQLAAAMRPGSGQVEAG